MCGLAGEVRFDGRPARAELAQRMAATLRHRGPDASGQFAEGPVAFAHQRLAIIDLAGGLQPMATARAVVVLNGEIYNYLELRQELRGRGRTFRTASDTEVLLQMYEEYGPACVARLNGIFAFAVYDRERQVLLLARDHFGVKPLYLHIRPDRLTFASEVKALLADPEIRAEPHAAGVREYLTFQYVLGRDTMFQGITRLLPGEYQVVELASGAARAVRYWEPRFRVDDHHTERYFTEQVRWLLEDAVRLQMRSDVPVGAYLSGGMDSSLVTMLAARAAPGPLRAFTGRFDEGPDFDESPWARMVADACGASMHLITPTAQDLVELLPRLVYFMDEPVAGPGLFPQFMVSREAARHVKVVLGGQGGDEVFGGYVRYLVAYLEQALKGAIQESNDEAEHIVSLVSILPNLPALRQYQPMLRQFWSTGLFEDMDRRYFRLVDRSGGTAALLSGDFRESWGNGEMFDRFRKVFNHPDTLSYYNKMTHYDLVANLPALLQVEDRVTMASSLESRVPLLDHRLADLVARMPPAMKFRGGELKYILKRAVGAVLPEPVLHRKEKMGFPVPLHLWARAGVARDFFADVLLSQRCRARGLFDMQEVERLIDTEAAFGRGLWGLLNLELWYRTFIDAA